jgi:hypothetical protein
LASVKDRSLRTKRANGKKTNAQRANGKRLDARTGNAKRVSERKQFAPKGNAGNGSHDRQASDSLRLSASVTWNASWFRPKLECINLFRNSSKPTWS